MDDYSLTSSAFDLNNSPRLAMLAPRSCQRYLAGILAKGFGPLGVDVVPLKDANWVLVVVPVHDVGAVSENTRDNRVQDDLQDAEAIISLLDSFARSLGGRPPPKLLVAMRRGTAPREKLREATSDIIKKSPKLYSTKLVLIGAPSTGQLLSDAGNSTIPHGFFSAAPPATVRGRVIVGTHIRPGEEIHIEETVTSILAIVAATPVGSTFGYIGGKTSPSLSSERVLELARRQHPSTDFEVVSNYMMVSDAHRKRVIVVSAEEWEPDEYTVTIDLRYIPEGEEWSHIESLHIRPSIAVVSHSFAAEYFGQRPCVTYSTPNEARLQEKIVSLITSGDYNKLLKESENYAKEQLPRFIAQRYAALFRNGISSKG